MRAQTRVVITATLVAFFVAGACGCNSMSSHMNNQIGMYNYQRGNYVAARENFRRAAADNPQSASFVYNMGASARRQGDVAGAEQAYVQALQIDRGHQPSYHALAQLMNEQGRRAESTQMISSWAQAHPYDAGAQVEMAWLQRESGDINGAEQSLYRALAARPNDSIATAQLGQIYQDSGQNDRAVAMYRRSLRGNWMQPQVQSRLASLQNPNGFGGPPPTMFAENTPLPPAYAMGPGSAPLVQAPTWGQTAAGTFSENGTPQAAPPFGQTATRPFPANDDPAHVKE